jgi:hypothetical protein
VKGGRIATVVRVRRLQERLARSEVARRRAELGIRAAREAALWSTVAERAPVPPGATSPGVLRAHRHLLAGGVAGARRAGDDVAAAQAAVDHAMEHWSSAAQRREGIERLAERVAEAQQAEQARLDNLELDDLVIARWNRGVHR